MSFLEQAIGVVAPPECLSCGAEGAALCPKCAARHILPYGPRCYLCGTLGDGARTCQRCYGLGGLRYCWVTTDYIGVARELVKLYKFGHQRAAAKVLARLMAATLRTYLHNKEDYLIVPVPTATSRVRARSFDHCVLLARMLAKELGLNYGNTLVRTGQTRQVGSGRGQRINQLDGQYRLRRLHQVDNRSVLLIDDVVTTGATLKTAAKVLRAGGAKRVNAAVFAKRL